MIRPKRGNPKYIRPFQVIKRIGPIAYRIVLPPSQGIHEVFHISNLRAYILNSNQVIECEPMEIRSDLIFPEEPI